MRLLVDQGSHKILQVLQDSSANLTVTGKYVIEIPPGVMLTLDPSSYVLNAGSEDSGSITALMYEALLARYPQFSNIVFNSLLAGADVDDLDLTTNMVIGGTTYIPRYQTGRGVAAPPDGTAGFGTAVLPSNSAVTPARDGALGTKRVDITAAPINALATDTFCVYWEIGMLAVGADLATDYGVYAGANNPSVKMLTRLNPNDVNFKVYLSNDDGVTWGQVRWLETKILPAADNFVRLAFLNTGSNKIYLQAYAFMF